jgi:hypothetical protein
MKTPTIVISKCDGHYLVTSDWEVHVRDKFEDAAKLIADLLDKPKTVPEENWPNANSWVKDVLKDEIKEG